MNELSLPLLLRFVEECELSDAEDQVQSQSRPQSQPQPARRQSFGGAVRRRKARPRRVVLEIAALRAQVQALSLELDNVKAERQSGQKLLLVGPSHWQLEAQRQSTRRTAAQQENERLRVQVQSKILTAKRLRNVLKRKAASPLLKMLQRYDQDAMLRAMKWEGSLDEDLECAYLQTDAMMADAKIAGLPPIFFDARMRRNATTGLTVEFRRCLLVPRDLVATSHAYWQFVPHHRFSEFFVFDHTASFLENSMLSFFLFQCKRGVNQTQFHGRYQLRRFTSAQRVVLVWKTVLYSSSSRFRLHGRGWVVIQSVDDSAPSTSIQMCARYYPESDKEDMVTFEQAQKNVDLCAMIEFVTCAMEGYGAFPTHPRLLM